MLPKQLVCNVTDHASCKFKEKRWLLHMLCNNLYLFIFAIMLSMLIKSLDCVSQAELETVAKITHEKNKRNDTQEAK